MIVALFRSSLLSRPFSSPVPPLLLSPSVQEEREKGMRREGRNTVVVCNDARASTCLPQPVNRGRSLRSLHIAKKRVNGRSGGAASAGTSKGRQQRKKDNRKKEEEEKEEDRLVEPLIYGGCILKIERDRENVSRAVKRRTLAGHVRLTPLPKRPLPTARLRVGILLTERSQTYDPVYFRSYTCCRCVAVAGYR